MMPQTARTIRALGITAFAAILGSATVACDPKPIPTEPVIIDTVAAAGRFTARVITPTGTVAKGLSVQTLPGVTRPFAVYIPSTYDATRTWPMTLLLHGNGSSGEEMAIQFQSYAEAAGVIVVAPNSYGPTWDLILNQRFGIDVQVIDKVLKWSFDHIAVDPTRVSISGFSDGGTYSIWLGLKNGDLFSRVAAMSPCARVPQIRTGNPALFISHGLDDTVSPVDECSRLTVPELEEDGYSVQFVEYPSADGNGHFVIPEVLTQVLTSFLGGTA